MKETLNRKEFCELYAHTYNAKKGKSKEICENVFDLLSQCIKECDRVYIKGLGTFKKKMTSPRRIGDIVNGGTMDLPAREKIVFEPFNCTTNIDAEEE